MELLGCAMGYKEWRRSLSWAPQMAAQCGLFVVWRNLGARPRKGIIFTPIPFRDKMPPSKGDISMSNGTGDSVHLAIAARFGMMALVTLALCVATLVYAVFKL